MRRLLFAAAALLLAAPAARADRRSFIRAYEYATQPQGNLEVEIWNDLDSNKTSFANTVVTQRIELEYGLTDHWDVALYHVFQHQLAGEDTQFRFDSWRLETRYRFAEKGELPVDVMIYGELERPADFREPAEFEGKIILEKDFGKLGFVTNLIAEYKLGTGARSGHNYEVDLGARYEIVPQLRVGVEYWTQLEQQLEEGGDTSLQAEHFLGPSVSLASARVWLQVGAGVGLGNDKVFGRAVLGFNL